MIEVQTLKDADTEIGKIQHKQIKLESRLSALKEQRKVLLVDDGKGFFCKKCKKYVEKTDRCESSELCYDCLRTHKLKTFKKDTLAKLHGARVKDIDIRGYSINSITVNHDGKSTMLSAHADYDGDYCEGRIEIENEWNEEWDGKEVRPGEKVRCEKPLPTCE